MLDCDSEQQGQQVSSWFDGCPTETDFNRRPFVSQLGCWTWSTVSVASFFDGSVNTERNILLTLLMHFIVVCLFLYKVSLPLK